MKKSELVAAVAAKTKMTQTNVESVLSATIETIVNTVANGEKVVLTGFGSFERRLRAARKTRNPRTREMMEIPENNVPAFSAGKAFREAVNPEKASQ